MSSIRLNLVNGRRGVHLCRLELDLDDFREANAFADEDAMLAHIMGLLPCGAYFPEESRQELKETLGRYRLYRKNVSETVSVAVRESTPSASQRRSLQPSDEIARVQAQRDQARAELAEARRQADRYQALYNAAQEANQDLTGQVADLSARNSSLMADREKLEAEISTCRSKLLQSSADIAEYRRELNDCEYAISMLKAGDSEGLDPSVRDW